MLRNANCGAAWGVLLEKNRPDCRSDYENEVCKSNQSEREKVRFRTVPISFLLRFKRFCKQSESPGTEQIK